MNHRQLLAERLVRDQDETLAAAITQRLGVGWHLEDLLTRLECVNTVHKDAPQQYFLDGQALLVFYPPEFHQVGNVITLTQRVEHMGTGRKEEANG